MNHQVDGRILVEINEAFARDVLFITHALKRRKLISLIAKLKKVKKKKVEVKFFCENTFCLFSMILVFDKSLYCLP